MKISWLNFFDGEPCTGFPNRWLVWRLPSKWWKLWQWWKTIDISDCCKKHDEACSTIVFLKCLYGRKIVGTPVIVLVAMAACVIKYGKA